jgi:hypothetical protein
MNHDSIVNRKSTIEQTRLIFFHNPIRQDKLVIKVAKTTSHCTLALASMGPYYISQNTVVGKLECESYFPENYNAVEVVQVAVQKKKKKKRGAKKSDAVSIANSEGDIIM